MLALALETWSYLHMGAPIISPQVNAQAPTVFMHKLTMHHNQLTMRQVVSMSFGTTYLHIGIELQANQYQCDNEYYMYNVQWMKEWTVTTHISKRL